MAFAGTFDDLATLLLHLAICVFLSEKFADFYDHGSVPALDLTRLSGRVTVPGFAEVAPPSERPMNVRVESSMYLASLQTLIHPPF